MLSLDIHVELDNFTLEVQRELDPNGVTAIFGPNGSGKSTLLRTVAGFEPRARGRVAFADEVWLDSVLGLRVPAHRRPVGTLFQDARLFAHHTVAGNLRYAEKRAGAQQAALSLREVVGALDLEPLLDRRVAALSGGERQRVALGRTLLTRPQVLLLDEPLAALDPGRKREILPYLEALHPHFGIPTLYVSHSVDEVALLADRILVLAQGRVHALGPTARILEELDLRPLSERSEAASVLEARVQRHDPEFHLTWLDLAGQSLSVPRIESLGVGAMARLLVHARDVSLATVRPQSVSIRNVLEGALVGIEEDPDSAFAEVTVDLGVARLRARITRASLHELDLRVGSAVFALVKSVSVEGGMTSL